MTLLPVCLRDLREKLEHRVSRETQELLYEQRRLLLFRYLENVHSQWTNEDAPLLQGFPGPQGLVGLPGEKVKHFSLLEVAVIIDWLIFVLKGPQGKRGTQGLPGNEGPPVRTRIPVLMCWVMLTTPQSSIGCFPTVVRVTLEERELQEKKVCR